MRTDTIIAYTSHVTICVSVLVSVYSLCVLEF